MDKIEQATAAPGEKRDVRIRSEWHEPDCEVAGPHCRAWRWVGTSFNDRSQEHCKRKNGHRGSHRG